MFCTLVYSVAWAARGKLSWDRVPQFLLAQLAGALLGALAVVLVYHAR